ncbi:nicotinamide-nucleotide amidohydrolase family protein [Paracoccus litorisediminis]|uniref:Nicotinamide-nucleotide amidohydrolase family protein n=2 Tax=Paracoccus litorisediminis TaxID=2006130 RepID=A0A844HQA9_9RHOB|nr:nicotinamide-nucleotide amidohydrolase family protein [Paracoccus litorisediminis]
MIARSKHTMRDRLSDSSELLQRAALVMLELSRRDLSIATAESCTGGDFAALLTDVEGVSHAFDSGFVAYSDDAKIRCLGIDPKLIAEHGAVSREVAVAMADGALQRSSANFAISVTGFAGPTEEGREGDVHFALAARQDWTVGRHEKFGPLGRGTIRGLCLRVLLDMIEERLSQVND